jgi:hypothetical protein
LNSIGALQNTSSVINKMIEKKLIIINCCNGPIIGWRAEPGQIRRYNRTVKDKYSAIEKHLFYKVKKD